MRRYVAPVLLRPDPGFHGQTSSQSAARGRRKPRREPALTRNAMQELPVVRIAPNNPVFDLPVIVGIEEGLFRKAGLDVAFSATYADREKDSVNTPFMSRLKEQLFDCGTADSYNVCEWASIDRLERGRR